jgi:hypothetical protein
LHTTKWSAAGAYGVNSKQNMAASLACAIGWRCCRIAMTDGQCADADESTHAARQFPDRRRGQPKMTPQFKKNRRRKKTQRG